jgi:lipid-binding SYLF domain-containing protein
MKINRFLVTCRILAITLLCVVTLNLGADDAQDNAKKRTEIQKMANDTLARLYKAEPAARAAVQKGYGYAVFSNTGVKILFGGTGNGKGIATNNKTHQQTYMKMFEVQAGVGFGVKKFSCVFIFDNEKAFDSFVNSGWEFGGQASAAAKTAEKGGSMQGAASVDDGVWMYQMTDKGIALEITAKGTKYNKDDDLNKTS